MTLVLVFFFKQKTAYEMRISDWSSDVCSSDLYPRVVRSAPVRPAVPRNCCSFGPTSPSCCFGAMWQDGLPGLKQGRRTQPCWRQRSEEHTSELQSLMRISYAVFCLKKKNKQYYHLLPSHKHITL